jgi:MFS family permease
MQSPASSEQSQRWWQGVDRYCWIVLIIAALGWMFDTMDQNLFNMVRSDSVRELLGGSAADPARVKSIGGWLTSIFMIGWATGGFVFGVIGDRIGRTGTMILTIIIYAVFTGLSGLAWNWQSYAVMRFLTGLGVGGEWAAGAAIVAEVFPSRSRPMALGTLQSLSAVGNMMAAVITGVLSNFSWRWAYAVGALPAVLVFWIRRSVKEPEKWKQAKERASLGNEMGSIGELFSNPLLRRRTIAALMMAIAGQAALWGVGFWSVDLLRAVLEPYHIVAADAKRASSAMFFIQQVGAMLGIYAFASFSERTTRRIAFYAWFTLAWISIPTFFWGVAKAGGVSFGPFTPVLRAITFSAGLPPGAQSAIHLAVLLGFVMGFATLGPFSGYTVYFPELYPTRLRATGCGICYNGGRFLAAAAPALTGMLSKHFASKPGALAGGLPMAATVVSFVYLLGYLGTWLGPETKGKPLPEETDAAPREATKVSMAT